MKNYKTQFVTTAVIASGLFLGVVGAGVGIVSLNNDVQEQRVAAASVRQELDQTQEDLDEVEKALGEANDALTDADFRYGECKDTQAGYKTAADMFYDTLLFLAGGSTVSPDPDELGDVVDEYEAMNGEVCE